MLAYHDSAPTFPASTAKSRRSIDNDLIDTIHAHSLQSGYCWAGNTYLAKRHGVTERAVQIALRRLQDSGKVTVELPKGQARRIFLIDQEQGEVSPTKFHPTKKDRNTERIKDREKEEHTPSNLTIPVYVGDLAWQEKAVCGLLEMEQARARLWDTGLLPEAPQPATVPIIESRPVKSPERPPEANSDHQAQSADLVGQLTARGVSQGVAVEHFATTTRSTTMKKFNKSDLATLANLRTRLAISSEALEMAIAKYNGIVQAASEALESVITDYNELVTEAQEFRDQIVESMDAYTEDKSDKWQESDRGAAYKAWRYEWSGEDISTLDIETASELEVPDLSLADLLDALPVELTD